MTPRALNPYSSQNAWKHGRRGSTMMLSGGWPSSRRTHEDRSQEGRESHPRRGRTSH
jgi:hypothetical protein